MPLPHPWYHADPYPELQIFCIISYYLTATISPSFPEKYLTWVILSYPGENERRAERETNDSNINHLHGIWVTLKFASLTFIVRYFVHGRPKQHPRLDKISWNVKDWHRLSKQIGFKLTYLTWCNGSAPLTNIQKTLDLHLEYCLLHLLCKVEYYKTFLNPSIVNLIFLFKKYSLTIWSLP